MCVLNEKGCNIYFVQKNIIKKQTTRDSCNVYYEMYMEFVPNTIGGGNRKKT